MVEKGGPSVEKLLQKPNPTFSDKCGKQNQTQLEKHNGEEADNNFKVW